jgi:hypothetical protein
VTGITRRGAGGLPVLADGLADGDRGLARGAARFLPLACPLGGATGGVAPGSQRVLLGRRGAHPAPGRAFCPGLAAGDRVLARGRGQAVGGRSPADPGLPTRLRPLPGPIGGRRRGCLARNRGAVIGSRQKPAFALAEALRRDTAESLIRPMLS